MTLYHFPPDTKRYARLLKQLDARLVDHVKDLVVAIHEKEPLSTKEAVKNHIKVLTILILEMPGNPPGTEHGLFIRQAIRDCCQEIGEIAALLKAKIPSPSKMH